MNVVEVTKYGDFDMAYTDSIYIGDAPVPSLPNGTLLEDVLKALKLAGFSKATTTTLGFTDDYYCADPSVPNDGKQRLSN